MEAEKSPFDAVRAMMLENLERVGFVTQIYVDMVERTMRLFPGANQEQIRTFKEYVQRQVATNRDLMESLLRAKDFQEAFRIQVEYSVPVEDRLRGGNSDRLMDDGLSEFTHAFFWLTPTS